MDSVVEEVVLEPKKNINYFKILVRGIAIVVTVATPVAYEYNSYANRRVSYEVHADFDGRPTISTVHSGKDDTGKQVIVPLKVVNFGESEKEYSFLWRLDGSADLKKLYTSQNMDAFGDILWKIGKNAEIGKFHYPINLIEGRSTEIKREKLSLDFSVCVVQSKQTSELSVDGTYYLLNDAVPIYAKKDILDFAVKSHEGGHCYFRTYIGEQDETDPNLAYKKALMEVSGDLTSILDYARLTGTLDMFTDFWRPFRLASVGDKAHQTAWALDVLLKDPSIDLDAITRKGPEEIGPMVNYLMEKHFANEDGEFVPTLTPASIALVDNLKASKVFDGDSPQDEALKVKLKADIAQSMVDHRAKWVAIAPKDAVALFDERVSAWSRAFEIDIDSFTPSNTTPHQDRLVSKRPMGVLEYLTGAKSPL